MIPHQLGSAWPPPPVRITTSSNTTITVNGPMADAVLAGDTVHVLCACGRYIENGRDRMHEPPLWVCECGLCWVVRVTAEPA